MFEPLGDVRKIVIHHSTDNFTGEIAANAHVLDLKGKARGFDSISYHFVIGNGVKGQHNTNGIDHPVESADGGIEKGRPLWAKGAHAIPNTGAIGVCLVGNFNLSKPTDNQMQSLEILILHLLYTHDLTPEDVLGHAEYQNEMQAGKKCPGKNFDMNGFRKRISGKFDPGSRANALSVAEEVEAIISSTLQTLSYV